jgi:hypothetical protein
LPEIGFFDPDDKSFFDSIRAQIHLLSDMSTRLLSRMGPPVDVDAQEDLVKGTGTHDW